MITPAILQAAMGCTQERALLFARPLAEACERFSIDTPARLAAFLAQIGHESGGLRYVTELASGEAYEGRKDLGNTHQGDGVRFRGHGLIQITGRANHAEMRPLLILAGYDEVPDFEAHPERLTDPRWAAASAAAYWHKRNLSALADAGRPEDFERITRRINGGLNGQADRLVRWERAKAALAPTVKESLTPETTTKESVMPIPAFIGAALPLLIEYIPKLGKMFGSGSEVAERNIKAAEMAVTIAQAAVGASNAQEAVEIIKSNPEAAAKAQQAIEARWLELTEAGGDGIAGARKADAERSGKRDLLCSPSFWVTVLLLPLVYMVVGSVVGLWGIEWPSDVRAAIATAVVSLIVGGAAGYYWGQTTSRNRTLG
ncbi:MAG: hypothetical protein RJA63_3087 [Pseudomonadota bacterium]|jgi:putative chitinase